MKDDVSRVRCAAIAWLFKDVALLGPYLCYVRTREHTLDHAVWYYISSRRAMEFYYREMVSEMRSLGMPLFKHVAEVFRFTLEDHRFRYPELWSLPECVWLGDSETFRLFLEQIAADGDCTVRATAITYAAVLGPEDPILASYFETWKKGESDESLCGYISELEDFLKRPSAREHRII